MRLLRSQRRTGTFLAIAVLAGCATTHGLKTSRGSGEIRHYRADWSTIWDAAISSIGTNGLEIEEINEDQGYILAGKGLGLWSYGERVGIFINLERETENGAVYAVEVISKRNWALNITAKDWKRSVFQVFESKLPHEACVRCAPPPDQPPSSGRG